MRIPRVRFRVRGMMVAILGGATLGTTSGTRQATAALKRNSL